jgi:hypothetical protein
MGSPNAANTRAYDTTELEGSRQRGATIEKLGTPDEQGSTDIAKRRKRRAADGGELIAKRQKRIDIETASRQRANKLFDEDSIIWGDHNTDFYISGSAGE